jgi:hypothetical protein
MFLWLDTFATVVTITVRYCSYTNALWEFSILLCVRARARVCVCLCVCVRARAHVCENIINIEIVSE